MPDNAKILYDALSAKGVSLGDYNLYSQKIQDPANRKKLFDVANKSGIPVGDFQMFESKLGVQPSTHPTATPQTFMQQRFPAMVQTGETINKGVEQLSSNPLAGVANIATGAINTVPSVAMDVIGNIPIVGETMREGIEGIGKIASVPVDVGQKMIGQTLDSYGIKSNANPELAQAMSGLNQSLAPIAIAPMLKGAKNVVKQGVGDFGVIAKDVLNESRIKKGTAELKQVAPPTNKELNYDKSLNIASKYIAEQERLTPINPKAELSPIRQALDNVKQAKERLWNEKITPAIEKNATITVDGGEIAKSIRESASEYVKQHDPNAVSALEDYARTFEKYDANGNKIGGIQIPIKDLNAYVTELNARTSAFQKSAPDVQALTENARPKIKGEVTAVEKMRELLYDKLDEVGSPEVRQLKKDYGALAQVHKAIERKIVPAERGNKTGSFYETPFGAGVKTVASIGTAMHNPPLAAAGGSMALLKRYLIDRNKPNPTITRSFKRFGKSNLTP